VTLPYVKNVYALLYFSRDLVNDIPLEKTICAHYILCLRQKYFTAIRKLTNLHIYINADITLQVRKGILRELYEILE
jgi:hypothetical protein